MVASMSAKPACLAGFFVFGFFSSAEHLAAAYVALPFSISHRSAPGHRRSQGCGFGAAIVVQRSAKFDGALTQPFVCLADGTRMMWREFRVSVVSHRQHFGNCFRLAFTAR